MNKLIFSLVTVLLLIGSVRATASISIIQSGADSGTVMLGQIFTVSVSGASSNAQATISLPTGFSLSGESSTKTTDNDGAVSWTAVVANQLLSGQTISVSISGQGSPTTVTSNSFGVITPPSLSATVSPSSVTVTQGQTFTLSLNMQNSGQTTTRFGTIAISPSDFSIYSGCSPSDISGSQSIGISCTIRASASATTGSQTLSILITPSNAASLTKQVSVTVNGTGSTTTTTSASADSSTTGAATQNVTITSSYRFLTLPAGVSNATFARAEIAVREVEVKTKSQVENILFEATKYGTKPSEVSAASGTVYQYLQITKGMLTDSNMEYAKMKFRVEKSWLSVNNATADSIALYKYENSAWSKIATTRTSEDSTYYWYEASVTSFSYFVIVSEAVAQTTTTETVTTVAQEGQTTTVSPADQTTTTEEARISLPTGPNVKLIVGVVLGVLIIGAVMFYLWKNYYRGREERGYSKGFESLKNKWS